MKIFAISFYLLIIQIVSIWCAKEYLLDTNQYQTTNLGWPGWKSCTSPPGRLHNWGYTKSLQERVGKYAICHQVDNQRAWLISPYISFGKAKKVYLNITYSTTINCPNGLKNCSRFLYFVALQFQQDIGNRFCEKEELYRRVRDTLDLEEIIHSTENDLYASQHAGEQLPLKKHRNITVPITVRDGVNGLYLFLDDKGSCSTIERIQIWYEVCHSTEIADVYFPAAVVDETTANISISNGTCRSRSLLVSNVRPTMGCFPNGTWDEPLNVRSCNCKPGYELLQNNCQPCQPGYYKTKVSNDKCTECPNGMQTFRNFTTHCYCTSYNIVKDQKCVSMPECKIKHVWKGMNMIEIVFNGLLIQNSNGVRYEVSYVSLEATSNNNINTSGSQSIVQKDGNATDQYNIQFSKLQAYTNYQFSITPVLLINNDYGQRMELKKTSCAINHIQTSPGIPADPPQQVLVISNEIFGVYVRWESPKFPKGVIEGYKITIYPIVLHNITTMLKYCSNMAIDCVKEKILNYTIFRHGPGNSANTNERPYIYEYILPGDIYEFNASMEFNADVDIYMLQMQAKTSAGIYGPKNLPIFFEWHGRQARHLHPTWTLPAIAIGITFLILVASIIHSLYVRYKSRRSDHRMARRDSNWFANINWKRMFGSKSSHYPYSRMHSSEI